MASLADISQKLLPEYTFHLFNRGIDGQIIFFKPENYFYFLRKFAIYTKDYLDIYAYCLLPNHFHFLVRVKATDEILSNASKEYLLTPRALQKEVALATIRFSADMPNFENLAYLSKQSFTFLAKHPQQNIRELTATWIVSNQLRKFFLAYAKAINKQESRSGGLMQKPFRRKLVDDKSYLIWLVWYLHRNPMHHKVSTDFENYPYSSYQRFLSDKPSLLKREEVFDYLEGKEKFIQFHEREAKNWKDWEKYVIE